MSKKHAKIDKLNEQALQTSIKNQMLGKDVNRHEYWFFKEEPTKIFIKYIERKELQNEGLMEVDEG